MGVRLRHRALRHPDMPKETSCMGVGAYRAKRGVVQRRSNLLVAQREGGREGDEGELAVPPLCLC